MKDYLSRRDFLKLAWRLPLLPLYDTINQVLPENFLYLEWEPTQSPVVDACFKQAKNPFQQWEYQFALDPDHLLYGLSLSAAIATSALKPNTLLFITEQPRPEMYTFSKDAYEGKESFLENTQGQLIRSSVDARYVENALWRFKGAYQMEFFLYVLAAVPQTISTSKTIPRYIHIDEMSTQTEKLILSNPIEPFSPDIPPWLSQNISTSFPTRQPFISAVKITEKDDSQRYYTVNVVAEKNTVSA